MPRNFFFEETKFHALNRKKKYFHFKIVFHFVNWANLCECLFFAGEK